MSLVPLLETVLPEPSEAAAALRNPSTGEIIVIIAYSDGHGLPMFMMNARA